MLERGYLPIAPPAARVHWTLPVALLAFAALRPAEVPAYGLAVLAHALGHVAVARRLGLAVAGVDLHGLGGRCRWTGEATRRQAASVAWGGVLAQSVLSLALASPVPASLLLLHLLPVAPLDGATAWGLPRLLWRRFRRARRPGAPALAASPGAEALPPGVQAAVDLAFRSRARRAEDPR